MIYECGKLDSEEFYEVKNGNRKRRSYGSIKNCARRLAAFENALKTIHVFEDPAISDFVMKKVIASTIIVFHLHSPRCQARNAMRPCLDVPEWRENARRKGERLRVPVSAQDANTYALLACL